VTFLLEKTSDVILDQKNRTTQTSAVKHFLSAAKSSDMTVSFPCRVAIVNAHFPSLFLILISAPCSNKNDAPWSKSETPHAIKGVIPFEPNEFIHSFLRCSPNCTSSAIRFFSRYRSKFNLRFWHVEKKKNRQKSLRKIDKFCSKNVLTKASAKNVWRKSDNNKISRDTKETFGRNV